MILLKNADDIKMRPQNLKFDSELHTVECKKHILLIKGVINFIFKIKNQMIL